MYLLFSKHGPSNTLSTSDSSRHPASKSLIPMPTSELLSILNVSKKPSCPPLNQNTTIVSPDVRVSVKSMIHGANNLMEDIDTLLQKFLQ